MVHSPVNGNPGGYALFPDAVQDPSSLAAAPAPFLGDLRGFASLSFEHKLFSAGASATGFAPYVVVLSSGPLSNLDALIWTAPALPPGTTETDWIPFEVALDETDLTPIANVNLSSIDPSFPNLTPSTFGLGGTMSIEEILGSVDLMLLPFEIVDNMSDQMDEQGGLDNVMLTPVPEPTVAAMLVLGLAGLALHSRGQSRSIS